MKTFFTEFFDENNEKFFYDHCPPVGPGTVIIIKNTDYKVDKSTIDYQEGRQFLTCHKVHN